MSIRTRLSILVVILMMITLTIVVYLGAAFVDTRQRLAEANAALREFELAVNTGASIAQIRLELLHHLGAGSNLDHDRFGDRIRACTASFELWVASSQNSIAVGIENEVDDLDAIMALYAEFERDLDRARTMVETHPTAQAAAPPFFEALLESGIQQITEDDIRELNSALDGVLLSMGTTPWIARIGPAQLASARATLFEIDTVQVVRIDLLNQAYRLAEFLFNNSPEAERALATATGALEMALEEWGQATAAFTAITGETAPPFYANFSARNPAYQQYIKDILRLVHEGHLDKARELAELPANLSMEDDLLAAVDSSLTVETGELRDMLRRLATSTGTAGVGGIALMCAILLSALTLFLSTARTMLRSLDQLRTGTELIGAGNFHHRVNLTTSDELGRLGANFDAMAEKLQEQVIRQKSLEEELLRNERLATLGQVIATVSHEIRNPLGTIQAAIYSLRKRLGDSGDAIEKTLDRAERSTRRCDRIIQELLDYTRTREPDRVETELDPWLSSVLDDFNLPPGIVVTRALHSNTTVTIDRNRLQGCVVNLLSNACQSMLERAGGPWLCELHIESRRVDGRVEVRVTDSGPGIAQELLEKIFEAMFSTRTFGVGLGLPIVKKYMEQHDGGIDMMSETGHGAVATLWLPAPENEEKQDEESPHTGG